MFTENDYLVAWLSYVAGFVLFFSLIWVATKNIPWPQLRYGLRIVLAVFFLTPWFASDQGQYLSPAWLMSLFEGVFENNYMRAGLPLLATMALSLALFLIGCWLYWQFSGGKAVKASQKKSANQRKTPKLGRV